MTIGTAARRFRGTKDWRGGLRPVLMATTALLAAAPMAFAEERATLVREPTLPAAPVQMAQQPPQMFTLAIPAQPLPEALVQFSRTTGLDVLMDSGVAAGRQTAGVSGQVTAEEGLRRLLGGTDVTYRMQGPNTAVLLRGPDPNKATQMPAVTSEAQRHLGDIGSLMPEYTGGQIARGGRVGMLGNKDVMDTPFSQTNYTNKTIQNQQARTVQDVLLNDPSIVTKQNRAGDEDGAITIRGFTANLSTGFGTLNGLAGMAPLRSPDMDYIERVEVLRGPSALLNGMASSGSGGIGGSYNLVTKQAGDEPLIELTTRYGSDMQLGAHLDVGRRFGTDKEFGIRVNGAFRKGDTPVDPISEEVASAAINMDYRGERFRMALDVAHQSHDANPQNVQQLVVSGVGGGFVFVPRAPDASTSLNPVWSEQPSNLTLGMLRGDVDILDNLTAYGAIGKQVLDFSLIGPSQPTLRAADGTYGWNLLEYSKFSYDVLSMQGGLRATVETGPVGHALSLNLSQSETETGEAGTQRRPYNVTTNLYNPVFGPEVILPDPGDTKKISETRVSSIGIADTLSFLDERIQFTGGIRYQEVESSNFNTTTGAETSNYKGNAWTPALGLVVKPWQHVSLYANYIENLQQGIIVGSSFANSGEVFPPYVSKQHEAGVKVDIGTVTTTLAAFQIAQPNTITTTDAATGLARLGLNGELRNRGIEMNAYGEPVSGVRFMGGVTLIDSQQTKTQSGLYDGNREAGVPKVRSVVGGEWDLPFLQGLTLTGRVTYTGNQVVSSSNKELKIPSWEVVDLGARYVFDSPWNDKPITVRFNVDNVFDKDYWSGTNFRYVQLGAPRAFWLSTTFAF